MPEERASVDQGSEGIITYQDRNDNMRGDICGPFSFIIGVQLAVPAFGY
jgi:hypothetical protein